VRLDRNELDDSGLVVARVTARVADPGPNGATGLNIALNPSPDLTFPTRGDQSPVCNINTDPFCPGPTVNASGVIQTSSLYNNYTAEVVDRLGADSFTPGHGVLFSRTKNADNLPFVYIMDARPEDMNRVDFLRPDGTPSMVTIADWRQLNDATFHAGIGSGSQYEYVDEPNRLHFYVIDNFRQRGIRSYQIGVRSLDGSGPQARGVKLGVGKVGNPHNGWVNCTFSLNNTGEGVSQNLGAHPENVDRYLENDIYRLAASVTGNGWSGQLYNALATAKFGSSAGVRVYVERAEGASGNGTVTLQATSESDPRRRRPRPAPSGRGTLASEPRSRANARQRPRHPRWRGRCSLLLRNDEGGSGETSGQGQERRDQRFPQDLRPGEAEQARQALERRGPARARAGGGEEPVDRREPDRRRDDLDEGAGAAGARELVRHARLDRHARREARAASEALPRQAPLPFEPLRGRR
jgi:hypothetical protein